MFLNFRFFYTGFYCVILNRRTVTWNLFVKLIDITSEQIFNIIQVSWTSWFRKHDPNALLGVYYFIWLIWGCSTGQGIVVCPPLSKTASRVLPRIYQVGEKSWVAEGDEHPKGIRGLPPNRKFLEMNMRWDAIWCISRHNFEKCYSVFTNLVTSGWFLRHSCSYTVMITRFFFGGGGGRGKLGIWGGGLLPLKYPR